MSEEDEAGKLFVGGLSFETTAEKLSGYFSKFGEIKLSQVLKDNVTNHSRGFGFVQFTNPAVVDDVLKVKPHYLDNKQIDPKLCTPKQVQRQKKEAEEQHISTYKIFVGGLAKTTTEDEVKTYFEKFGNITEVVFAVSKEDHLNKGFGFVTFESEEAVTKAIEEKYHDINGKQVEAKRAQSRDKMREQNRGRYNNNYYGNNQSFTGGYGHGDNQNNWGGNGQYGQGGSWGGYDNGYNAPYQGQNGPGGYMGGGNAYGYGSGYGNEYGNYRNNQMYQQNYGGYGYNQGYNQPQNNSQQQNFKQANEKSTKEGYHPYKR